MQGERETDEAAEKITPATNHKILYRIGSEPRRAKTDTWPWGDERGAQRQDEGDQSEVATVSRDRKTTPSALDVKRMQNELETVFMERLDQGFVRIAEPAPHEARRAELCAAFMAWSALAAHSYVERRVRGVECRANAEPQPALHVRVRSEPTAAQDAEPTAAQHGAARTDERGAVGPRLPQLETPASPSMAQRILPRRIRRMSTSMLASFGSSEKPRSWPGQA